jgi:hypothetical protein
MKKNLVSKINPNAERIPVLDDYELKPHYDIDYTKTRPNPYAGRVKLSNAGARNGSRKSASPARERHTITLDAARERHTITLDAAHAKFLRSLDPNLSRAIRKLIESR